MIDWESFVLGVLALFLAEWLVAVLVGQWLERK